MKYTLPNIRMGSTSFLLHEAYLPAIRFAAKYCNDIAILLIEVGKDGEFLVTPEEVREIKNIAESEGTTFHIHLPVDAYFDTYESAQSLVATMHRVIERTEILTPHTFVLHVDFLSLQGTGQEPSNEQEQWTAEALQAIASILPSPEYLAIENLESHLPTFWDRWLNTTQYSRCLDIGHFWKVGINPLPFLALWFPKIRLIHLHGLKAGTSANSNFSNQGQTKARNFPCRVKQTDAEAQYHTTLLRLFGSCPQDHASLEHMPPACVDAVMHFLWEADFTGVLNIEVFNFDNFTASHTILMQSWERYTKKGD